MKKPTSVKQILNSHASGLQELLQHTKRLNTLNKRIRHLLPPSLYPHCTAAGIETHTLTLLTDSPAWAARLRMQAPDIIKALHDFQITSIAVKVQPSRTEPEAPLRIRPKMSTETSELLSFTAEATSDPKLKLALQRLSRHSSK